MSIENTISFFCCFDSNQLFKGVMAFREHRMDSIQRREQLQSADALRARNLLRNHFGVLLYQWHCVKMGLSFLRQRQQRMESFCFDVWIRKFSEIQREQQQLDVGAMHWRQNQLRLAVADWSRIAHRGQLFRKYLSTAQHQCDRKVVAETFVVWHRSFEYVVRKKQTLYELQLAWTRRKEAALFISWTHSVRASVHYKVKQRTRAWTLWRALYQYHVAARYEREKHLSFCIGIFAKWKQSAVDIRKKERSLEELRQCFVDWRTRKMLREWRHIQWKHEKARRQFDVNLQRKALRQFMESVAISRAQSAKELEFADDRYRTMRAERAFSAWSRCYELSARKRQFLERKCGEYRGRREREWMCMLFRRWISRFHAAVNERHQMAVSAGHHNQYVLSRVFVEWKLFVKTSKYKSKRMAKSLSTLRHSVLMKSRNQKLSASQSYIRLSHQSLPRQSFGSVDSKHYLRIKGQEEDGQGLNDSIYRRMETADDDPDDSYLYDSVLLKSPSMDSTYN